MGIPIGTYIRSGAVLELPADVDALSLILAEHSESKVEVNPGELSLSIIREASIIQARKRIKDDLTPDKNLIQSIEALDEAHDTLNLVSERLVTWNSQVTGKPRIKIEKILEGTSLPSQVNLLGDFYSSTKALISALSKYLDHESPRVFPHLFNPVGIRPCGSEMEVAHLGDGMAKRFIYQTLGRLAAVDVGHGNIEWQ